MNRKTKIVAYAVIALVAIVGVVWANVARLNAKVSGISVVIDYAGQDTLVNDSDIKVLLKDRMPDLMTQTVKNVDTEKILNIVNTSPYLYNSDVSISVSREIIVRSHQRRPIALVYDNDKAFYIDSVAQRMPQSEHGSPDVIIANREPSNKKIDLGRICAMAMCIDRNEAYRDLFDQIYEDSHNDLYLVPKLGDHVVLIGDTNQLDLKMKNLMALYHRGLRQTGWDTYSLIILKYDGQVICRKR